MTSKIVKIGELMLIALDTGRGKAERFRAVDEADTLRKGMKVGWSKVWPGREQKDVDFLLSYIKEAPENFDDASDVVVQQEASEVSGTDREADERVLDRVSDRLAPKLVVSNAEVDTFMPETPPRPLTSTETETLTLVEPPLAETPKVVKPRKAKVVKPKIEGRGGISALVRELLLETDRPYDEIVLEVLKAFPKAATTARSIASVAADLRKAGKAVALRRRDTKVEG